MIRRLMIAAAVLTASLPAHADPIIDEHTEYYDVDGDTVEDIRAAMTANTPQEFWAFTQWYVSWTSTCEVTVKITYTYPDWAGYDDADPELQDYWDNFIKNLEIHEHGHGDNGRGAGQEIEDTRCGEDPYRIIRNWGQEDVNYDTDTDHGRTQGAVF